jgi:hypothetical protein
MSTGRLDLPTNGLKGHCPAIELRAHEVCNFIMHFFNVNVDFTKVK